MNTIAFISGKGGTGKTSLTAAFAALAAPTVVADCDVDAANLALLLPGEVRWEEPFVAGVRAEIQAARCSGCGLCAEACRFGALREEATRYVVEPMLCEGCGVCAWVCPEEAVALQDNAAGVLQILETSVGPLVRGALRPAQSNSGKLVARVRELASGLAQERGAGWLLLDGPPGIGCPVHATVTNVDLVVVVTEPTPSGEHDLERALRLLQQFQLPARVIVNKADLAPSRAAQIGGRVKAWGAEVVGELPFLEAVPRGLMEGRGPLDVDGLRPPLEAIWLRIQEAADVGRAARVGQGEAPVEVVR